MRGPCSARFIAHLSAWPHPRPRAGHFSMRWICKVSLSRPPILARDIQSPPTASHEDTKIPRPLSHGRITTVPILPTRKYVQLDRGDKSLHGDAASAGPQLDKPLRHQWSSPSARPLSNTFCEIIREGRANTWLLWMAGLDTSARECAPFGLATFRGALKFLQQWMMDRPVLTIATPPD